MVLRDKFGSNFEKMKISKNMTPAIIFAWTCTPCISILWACPYDEIKGLNLFEQAIGGHSDPNARKLTKFQIQWSKFANFCSRYQIVGQPDLAKIATPRYCLELSRLETSKLYKPLTKNHHQRWFFQINLARLSKKWKFPKMWPRW